MQFVVSMVINGRRRWFDLPNLEAVYEAVHVLRPTWFWIQSRSRYLRERSVT